MSSTPLRRARTWTLGVLSVSTVATGLVAVHLGEDHAAALAATTRNTTRTTSGSGSNATQPQPSDGSASSNEDDGSAQDTGHQSGFTAPSPLGAGSGAPQVTSHGS